LKEVIKRIKCYALFMLYSVFMFSAFYEVTGGQFDNEEYPNMPKVVFNFLQVFRMSMGDIQAIEYKTFLIERYNLVEDKRIYLLITFLWVIWIVNCFLVNIIMLNFIIAIISQNYEEVINNEEQY
jgi:hypothetical protein